VEKIIEEAGEEAAFDAGVAGLPPQVLNMLGRLKFRTSFGQNSCRMQLKPHVSLP
jgi:ribonuclease Y